MIGYKDLQPGSKYVAKSTDTSVDAEVVAGGGFCRLVATIDPSEECTVLGKQHPCGGLMGLQLSLKQHKLPRIWGASNLRVSPPIGIERGAAEPTPVRVFRMQLVERNFPQEVSVEDLARSLTLVPETVVLDLATHLGPKGARLALFPGDLFVLVTGDSVFLESAWGRLKANSLYPLVKRWCARWCLAELSHRDAPVITTREFNQYGAVAEVAHATESCRKELVLAVQLEPAYNALLAALAAVLALLALLKGGSMRPEWVAQARPVCERLQAAVDIKVKAAVKDGLFTALRGSKACLMALEAQPKQRSQPEEEGDDDGDDDDDDDGDGDDDDDDGDGGGDDEGEEGEGEGEGEDGGEGEGEDGDAEDDTFDNFRVADVLQMNIDILASAGAGVVERDFAMAVMLLEEALRAMRLALEQLVDNGPLWV